MLFAQLSLGEIDPGRIPVSLPIDQNYAVPIGSHLLHRSTTLSVFDRP